MYQEEAKTANCCVESAKISSIKKWLVFDLRTPLFLRYFTKKRKLGNMYLGC